MPGDFASLSNQRSFRGFTLGNPGLKNEKADSFTGGIALTPTFLPGFDATIDYIDITLKSAISQFGTTQVVNACYDSVNYPNNIFCSLVQRDAAYQLSSVSTSYFHSATFKYRGILADIHYRHRTPLLGAASSLDLKLSYQYLDNLSRQVTAGSRPLIIDGSTGYSRHKGVLTINYDNGPLNYQTQIQYIGSAAFDPNLARNFYSIPNVNEVAYVNMSVNYRVTKYIDFRVNVDNILDTGVPSPLPINLGADEQNTYFTGLLGRYIRVGVGAHF